MRVLGGYCFWEEAIFESVCEKTRKQRKLKNERDMKEKMKSMNV